MKMVTDESLHPIKDLVLEYGEITLDALLKEGVLRDIPILRTLVAFEGSYKSISEQILLHNLVAFINGYSSISPKKRAHMVEIIDDDSNTLKNGYRLMSIIQKADDERKACLLGALLHRKSLGAFNAEQFWRLCYIIDKCFYDDLLALNKLPKNEALIDNGKIISQEVVSNLSAQSLIIDIGFDGGSAAWNDGATRYKLSESGIYIAETLQTL